MTDEGLLPVAAACPHLRMLSVHGVRTVTDALIETLANTCKDTLTTIDIKGKSTTPTALVLKLTNIDTSCVPRKTHSM
jgi:dihydropteroate synthase